MRRYFASAVAIEVVSAYALATSCIASELGADFIASRSISERITIALSWGTTPPSKINQFLHPDIEAICMRALDKDLGTRYATVEGMLADMQRHRRGKKVERKSSRGVGRWLEKNKVPFLVGAGVASAGWALIVAYLLIT